MNRAVYKNLFQTYGQLPAVWFGMLLSIAQTLLNRVGIALIMAQVANDVALSQFDQAYPKLWLMLIVYFLATIAGTLGDWLTYYSTNEYYAKLGPKYAEALLSKDMAFYRDHQTGYLISLYRQYMDTSLALVRSISSDVIPILISLTIPAVILIGVSLPIGLAAVAVTIVQVAYILWASSFGNKYRLQSHEAYRKLTGKVTDTITNIVAFKAQGSSDMVNKEVKSLHKLESDAFWRRHKTIILLDLPRSLITPIGVFVAFYFAIQYAETNSNAIAVIVLTITFMYQILRNVGQLPSIIMKLDDHITKIYPTLEYFGETSKVIDPKHPKPLNIHQASLEFSNVDFSYDIKDSSNTVNVFKNLSLHIRAGEQVGIVGLSGAGKSTLANLIMRFDDISAGQITIDGTDIRDVKQDELRSAIAYVPQEPLLFHQTIRENIAYHNDKASDESIIRAAKAAHAHEFISQLPNGYDSTVGERGVKLSGGQKQRIAIARAVMKDAPIIVFDEATSALDSESEEIIQQALPEILGKRTAIIIAHRLSTVAKLDRILVFENGEIIEEGTHTALLQQTGRYSRLWKKQTRQEK